MEELSKYVDATAAAAQLGRLDLVSLLLASIGLILALGGLFAFFNFRAVAKKQASEEATRVAEEVAERTANDYLQRELPGVVKAYREIMDFDGVADEIADQLARAQEDPKGGTSE